MADGHTASSTPSISVPPLHSSPPPGLIPGGSRAGLGSAGSKGFSPEAAGFSVEFQYFVQLSEDRASLSLQDEPFFITGFNNYYLHSRAAWLDSGRREINEVFSSAEHLGFNIVRCWAFADGDVWHALQPERGIIDESMFREGLDYVVSEARKHGIRLILTLTNGQKEYGGMEQYVKWNRKHSISDFYSDPDIKDAFKDYVYTLLHRVNTIDQVAYKDNPTILGWDIANEPTDPGHPSSQALQQWIEEMSSYVKMLDPHHLVMIGWEGFFGASTPDKIQYNPYVYMPMMLTDRVYKMDEVCFGTDFYENHLPEAVDLCVAHLYPDTWTACDEHCKMQFSKNWIRAHLELAMKLNRPFLLGEFGKQRPISYRNAFLKMVHSELLEAYEKGLPVAGSLVWMFADKEYPDYDGFSIYNDKAAVMKPRPKYPPLDQDSMTQTYTMRNRDALLDCMWKREMLATTVSGKGRNKGWKHTLDIITNYTRLHHYSA